MDYDMHFATPEVMEMAINIVSDELIQGKLNPRGASGVKRIHEVLGMIIDMPEDLDVRSVMVGACLYAAQRKACDHWQVQSLMLKDPFRGESVKPVEGSDEEGLEKE